VIVRWRPLVTAAYGTRMARPARTTLLRTWRQRLPACPRHRSSEQPAYLPAGIVTISEHSWIGDPNAGATRAAW
jgi:hypothetical protein